MHRPHLLSHPLLRRSHLDASTAAPHAAKRPSRHVTNPSAVANAWYGAMVGFVGTATGVILGVVICWVMTRFRLLSFPPDIAEVYFVSSIPFVTRGIDLSVISAFSLLVSFLATIVPSLRAARLNPVDALRHE